MPKMTDFIKIEEIDDGKTKTSSFKNLDVKVKYDIKKYNNERKQKRMDLHHWITEVLSIVMIGVFLYLLIIGKDVPSYYIGFIGAVIAFYFSRHSLNDYYR